ncbi:LLM class flavin-dependent oxidoreductase [Nonomuraea sp. NEAU-A123]|uniref:LLM class flavin-dependent oxidoreductase n=1 Tax=Nonomuraea sp. NEAU-A123 TaxID=2839649 RepID=UPI001BE45CBD|nr:LLM class flavin-dependent oxidoreductase [Nonomuraea sp. NEAU-A123]MBT2233950.1 LLM class flavin-dependent oxidoreductase [Nonomuraea sp. NEAU-A123]
MTTHPFRFGAVAGHDLHPDGWGELGRRAEGLGFTTLLVPDHVSGVRSPFAAAAVVAAATTTLRVGTYVVDVPSWTPESVARETAGLRAFSGGRFELGLGAAPPVTGDTPAEQVRRLARTAAAVRDVPILIAASCSGLLKVAAEKADTVALWLPPWCAEAQVAAMLDELYELAGDRYDHLELSMGLATEGTGVLTRTPDQMATTLRERRDKLGISYVTVNVESMDSFAPVVAMLSGT